MTAAIITPHNMIQPSLLLRTTIYLHHVMSNRCASSEEG